MEYRKSQWTESISSLLRKTEMNLIRIQTPYHEEVPRTYTSMTYQTSFYDNPIMDQPPRPQNDFIKEDALPMIQQEISSVKNSLEKMLQERLRSQKKDIDDIGERLVALEVGTQDIDRFKEETRNSLYSIEKRCLGEIKRIEGSGKGFVTQEDLKIATDSVKHASLNSLKQLEHEIEYVKTANLEIKEEVFRMTEDKVREMVKRYVSHNEFNGLR